MLVSGRGILNWFSRRR